MRGGLRGAHPHDRRRAPRRARVGPRGVGRASRIAPRRAQRHQRGRVARRQSAVRRVRRGAGGAHVGPRPRSGRAARATPRCSCAPTAARRRVARIAAVRCTQHAVARCPSAAGADDPPRPGPAPSARRCACGWRRRAASGPPTNSDARFPASGSSWPMASIPSSRSMIDRRSWWRPAALSPSPRADTAPWSCWTGIGCCRPKTCASASHVCGGGRTRPLSRDRDHPCTWSASPDPSPEPSRHGPSRPTPEPNWPTERRCGCRRPSASPPSKGPRASVDAAIAALREAVPALDDDAILGPVSVDAGARALVRFDYAHGLRVAESLRGSIVADALRARKNAKSRVPAPAPMGLRPKPPTC